MKKIILFTFLLCILNSIIIVNQQLGINVILFTIPLLLTIVYVLKEYKLIKNKKGLLFLIPIIVLSLTFFIYDNSLKYLNILVIPILYLLMYIITIKPENNIFSLVRETINISIKPLEVISSYLKQTNSIIFKNKIINDKTKKIMKSLLIVVPVVLIVILLLTSADSIFSNLFKEIIVIKNISISDILSRIILFFLLFIYLGSTLYFLSSYYLKEEKKEKTIKERDPLTIKILLVTLDIIYLVFDIIQINSLLLHRVASGFNYAEYARSGFFQLMLISFINVIIILYSKKCKEDKSTKAASIIMVLLTYIIIASSFYRMFLYEQAYGYTLLRLGVYSILATEALLFIPTIVYILNKNVNILNWYLLISISIYTFINCFSVDRIITYNNINRYYKTKDIDIEYLMNLNYDNIPQLREFSKEYKDKDNNPETLKKYINTMDKDNKTNIFEYNLAKSKAKKKN